MWGFMKKRKPKLYYHAICEQCYRASTRQRAVIAMDYPHCDEGVCCFCGDETHAGIVVQDENEQILHPYPIYSRGRLYYRHGERCGCHQSWYVTPKEHEKNLLKAYKRVGYSKIPRIELHTLVKDGRGGAHLYVRPWGMSAAQHAKELGAELYEEER